MKQNVSPKVLILAGIGVALLIGFITWKTFFSSNTALSGADMKEMERIKEKKETKGETH
jgi:hypothetical protein